MIYRYSVKYILNNYLNYNPISKYAIKHKSQYMKYNFKTRDIKYNFILLDCLFSNLCFRFSIE